LEKNCEEMPGRELDQVARAVPVGRIDFKEVAVARLPLFIVITCQVFDVDLPQKEFLSEDEFEEYLRQYAGEKFSEPARREKFIKKHLDTAIYLEDEIIGGQAWQFNGEVRFKNARSCGFGILKTQSKQFYIFQTSLGRHLPSQMAAYQALTYGLISPDHLALFAGRESRERLRSIIGPEVYAGVAQALGISSLYSAEGE